MNLHSLVSKVYRQFRYNDTGVMLCDYKASFLDVEAVALAGSGSRSFSKARLVIPLEVPPDSGDDADVVERLNSVFAQAGQRDVKYLALSVTDLCGTPSIPAETARCIVEHILRCIAAGNMNLTTLALCSKELPTIRQLESAMGGLVAREAPCGRDTYKLVHPEGRAPAGLDCGGRVETSFPSAIPAGEHGSWTVRYMVGRRFPKNAQLSLAITHPSNWMIPQFAVEDAPGYSSVTAPCNAKFLAVRQPATGVKGFHVKFKLLEGELTRGDTIEVTLGDTSKGSSGLRAQTLSGEGQSLKIMGDFEDAVKIPWQHHDYVYGHPTVPRFDVIPGKVHRIDLVCPAHVSVAEPFRAILRVCDGWGNLCPDAELEASVCCAGETPAPVLIKPADNGYRAVEGLQLTAAGTQRLRVEAPEGRVLCTGNPILVSENRPRHTMFWGDLHMHSALSDGIGDPDTVYNFARNVTGLDIAALADHDFVMAPNKGHWERCVELAEKWHEPQRFVTLLGYEFTERKIGGDRNVYYLSDRGPLIDSGGNRMHPDELYCRLAELDFPAMVIPHCTLENHAWQHSDPRFCRLSEVYSTHGSSEDYPCDRCNIPDGANYDLYPPESCYAKSFDFGLKLGAIGGTDDHGGQPGWGYSWHHHRGGIMGVLATELTREAVWEALWTRRTIATTGERIYLNMTVNGLLVGEEGTVTHEPEIEIDAAGTAKIDLIELLRNEEIIQCFHGRAADEKRLFVDTEWNGDPAWYRCRLTQADGERAWTSPIWVTND